MLSSNAAEHSEGTWSASDKRSAEAIGYELFDPWNKACLHVNAPPVLPVAASLDQPAAHSGQPQH